MRKLFVTVLMLFAMTAASHAKYYHPHMSGGGGGGNPFGGGGGAAWCAGGCVAVAGFEGLVLGLIIEDERRRFVAGPDCATNKMTRQSYFGVVRDEPKLWRKLCNWKDPVVASKAPISIRGALPIKTNYARLGQKRSRRG